MHPPQESKRVFVSMQPNVGQNCSPGGQENAAMVPRDEAAGDELGLGGKAEGFEGLDEGREGGRARADG